LRIERESGLMAMVRLLYTRFQVEGRH